MKSHDLRVRLLAVIGATTVASLGAAACGSETSTSTAETADAAQERGDARADAADSSAEDSSAEDSSTGATDAATDVFMSIRRPFLVGSSMRSARSEVRDDWTAAHPDADDAALDAVTKRELARAWLADALEEHASIAAFARFTMLMLSVGAPPELVVASQRASIDEVAHARDCFALAQRYGASAAGPGELDVHDALGPMSLADLAALTAEEGCVGETLATEQLERAVDPGARREPCRSVHAWPTSTRGTRTDASRAPRHARRASGRASRSSCPASRSSPRSAQLRNEQLADAHSFE
jgi:hypothetical protein